MAAGEGSGMAGRPQLTRKLITANSITISSNVTDSGLEQNH
jgi:hypothetical protein